MASNEAADLVRRPEDPREATFLELFFDLAFVFALTQLSFGLIQNLTWRGAFQTLLLLLAVWWIWSDTALLTDVYSPQRSVVQVLVTVSMVGTVLVAVALPEAFGAQGLVFAGVYLAIRVGRCFLLLVAARVRERQRDALRVLAWAGVSAVPWIAGALAPGTGREVLWALAVVVDYTGFVLRWPTPGLGPTSQPEFSLVSGHFAERHRQFFIIALGELILVTGLALRGSGFPPDRTAAFLLAITTTVLLWRIYIYRAGEVLATALTAARKPQRAARATFVAHLVMVAGVVAIAVGAELVIAHPLGHAPPAWITVILGGPALFLAGRAGFEYAVFNRVSWARWIGLLVLAALLPAMQDAPPLLVSTAATVVLAGIAVADAARSRRRPSELPMPPGGPT
ncbi:low temperature requirement protein A [Micromonospora sp. A200]|uniref:low temperature requirement protein A n=1 Tax=unclassified Micromonospora TaxID=2617518 RepID=UPI002474FAF5|nr:low temperature requirement protein A [Micromonospora sp. A200]MDH6465809.1 low temperature requirement protein LtrA [Micromonospora sp. A200]